MRSPEPAIRQPSHDGSRREVSFPRGLHGFSKVTRYWLLGRPEEAPFRWLEMVEDSARSFLVVAPEAVIGRYEPSITREDAAFLGISELGEALVLAVVGTSSDGPATMNLKSPIVINVRTWIGQQIIPCNVSAFTSRYPLRGAVGCPSPLSTA